MGLGKGQLCWTVVPNLNSSVMPLVRNRVVNFNAEIITVMLLVVITG